MFLRSQSYDDEVGNDECEENTKRSQSLLSVPFILFNLLFFTSSLLLLHRLTVKRLMNMKHELNLKIGFGVHDSDSEVM